MVRKRFFGHISGTKSPRTKIFALLGSSYMTGPWGNIKFFGALGAFVDFKKHAILKISSDKVYYQLRENSIQFSWSKVSERIQKISIYIFLSAILFCLTFSCSNKNQINYVCSVFICFIAPFI